MCCSLKAPSRFQNRLYLSWPGGGWRDATSELPQLSDFSHSAAIGDIRNIGDDDRILPYVLLNGAEELDRLAQLHDVGCPDGVAARG